MEILIFFCVRPVRLMYSPQAVHLSDPAVFVCEAKGCGLESTPYREPPSSEIVRI